MSKFGLAFLALFFGGILYAFMITPTAAFVLYQLVYFLNPDNRWWSASIPGLRYSMITVLLMVCVLTLHYRRLSELSPWHRQPVFKWIIGLLVLYFYMNWHAVNPVLHRQFTIDLFKLIVIILIAYKLIHSERALHAVLWAYVLGATYIGYLATVTGRNMFGRVEGIGMVDGTDANDTSAALVPATILLMYFAWMGSKKVKVLCVLCGALLANGLVLANSRGAFLGISVGVGTYILIMLFSRYQKPGQRVMALLIVALGLGGGLYVTDDLFWERMGTLQSLDDGAVSGASRTEFWLVTFDIMRDYPTGVGINGYQTLSSLYLSEDQLPRNHTSRAVHSSWFQLLAELGWPGPIVFAGLLGALYLQNRRTKRWLLSEQRTDEYFLILALECAFLAYLVTVSVIDRFRAEVFYWQFLFMAAAANVYYLQAQQRLQEHKNSKARQDALSLTKRKELTLS